MLDKAITLTSIAFEGKKDKRGNFYIFHCLAVLNGTMKQTDDDDVLSAAVMHDLVEDFPLEWTLDRVSKEGFSDRTVYLLSLLTHDDNEPYMDYIIRISQDIDAIHIKMADLEHNSFIGRAPGLREKDFLRSMKYTIAYDFLSRVKNAANQFEVDYLAIEMKEKYQKLYSAFTHEELHDPSLDLKYA